MTAKTAVHFGPRLIGTPTGTLRAAVAIKPTPSIEAAKTRPGEPGVLYARALEQHATFCRMLEYFGVEIVLLEPAVAGPNEVAVGDAAVAFEDGAVLMRPTAMSRRAEADRLEAEFSRVDVPIAGHIAAPGLLDGGDVLLVGDTAFVGKGGRGNDIGRGGFGQVAAAHGYRVVDVALAPDAPCLRAVAGALAKDTVVLAPAKVDASAFAGLKVVALERGEDLAAGVLVLGERHVIADMRYRTSLRAMRKAGAVVESIDLYEFAKIGVTPSMLALALKRD